MSETTWMQNNLDTQPTRLQKIAGRVNAWLLPKFIDHFLDFKISHYDRSVDPARPEYNEHCVFSFWHEYIGLVLPRWGHTPLTVLVSKHRDGEWVNQTASALGMNIVRGSSTRGGSQAIRKLKSQGEFSSITFTPDGPKGPRREMAMGPVYLASKIEMPIVPVGVGFENPWRFDTWDKFAVPRPFTRARMIFGPKIYLPKKMNRDELEVARIKIQNLMNSLTSQAENWANSDAHFENEQPFVRVRRTSRLILEDAPDRSESTSLNWSKVA
ncbi:MAG: lysophospholipid acyltransferase family protein [Planctomycetota bacterium]